jgi:hypothetical protein
VLVVVLTTLTTPLLLRLAIGHGTRATTAP